MANTDNVKLLAGYPYWKGTWHDESFITLALNTCHQHKCHVHISREKRMSRLSRIVKTGFVSKRLWLQGQHLLYGYHCVATDNPSSTLLYSNLAYLKL